MLNKEELLQFGELLEPINKKLENVATKQDVKEIVEANNRILVSLFKIELATTTHEIIKAVKKGFQDIVKHEKKQDISIQDHDERIEILEASEQTHN